jgi:hypothetical protein
MALVRYRQRETQPKFSSDIRGTRGVNAWSKTSAFSATLHKLIDLLSGERTLELVPLMTDAVAAMTQRAEAHGKLQ